MNNTDDALKFVMDLTRLAWFNNVSDLSFTAEEAEYNLINEAIATKFMSTYGKPKSIDGKLLIVRINNQTLSIKRKSEQPA